MVDVVVARVAEPPARPYRLILVDRLWPRGLRKDQAPWDEWLRDAAPSTALRRWYGHDPARYGEFRNRYRAELDAGAAGPDLLRLMELVRSGPVAVLTSTRDVEQSQAPILAEFLRERAGGDCAPKGAHGGTPR